MALIKIDDKEFEAPKGANILQFCLDNGIDIPHFCYHPCLSVAGNCRMCLTEVQGFPKLAIACSTTVMEVPDEKKVDGKYDMVISTASEEVKKARQSVMEFLLINHPLDCPICDQAGECRLQEYSYEHGSSSSRFDEEKLKKDKRVDLGPHVLLDEERCIKCTRCIRFCDEVTETHELGLVERGHDAIIATMPGQQLDNAYSINTVDICPVGALTNKEFRFSSRVWFTKTANSVCTECSRGCSTYLDVNNDKLLRVRPRHNPDVNGYWMCDEGRLVFDRISKVKRKSRPLERSGDAMVPVSWNHLETTLGHIQTRFQFPYKEGIALVVSGRCTSEEMLALKLLSEKVFDGCDVLVPEIHVGEDDDLLIRKDKRPNMETARRLGFKIVGPNPDWPALLKGYNGAILFREDPVGEAQDEKAAGAIGKALGSLDLLLVADIGYTKTASFSQVFMPLTSFDQMEGIFVNFEGRAQRLNQASFPTGEVFPAWKIAQKLMVLNGVEPDFENNVSLMAELKKCQGFEELEPQELFLHGSNLRAMPGEPVPAPTSEKREAAIHE